MKCRLILLSVLLCWGLAVFAGRITPQQLEQALDRLDATLSRSDRYQYMRQAYIDSLVAEARANPSQRLTLSIADAYNSFNTDSALTWLNRADVYGSEAYPFEWRRAALLPLAGFIEEGRSMYEAIPVDSIVDADLPAYLEAGRQMYSYIAASYQTSPQLSSQYTDSMRLYQRRLLQVLDPDSNDYRFIQAEYYLMTNREAMAKVLFEQLNQQLATNSPLRARVAHHLSTIASRQDDRTAYLYYLAQSATLDLEAATREMVSLQELGAQLSDDQLERAYNYINRALQNAVECGAALRAVDTSQALPVIERAHNESIAQWRHRVYAIIFGMALLLLGLIVTMIILRHEMVKMRRLQQSLKQANRAKEVYISQFLQLCSVYMHKLTQFSKIVTRKLAAGQADELYRMTKSGKFVDEQSRDFYEIFDNAFLHIYPNFVADVNALLRPDSKIELKEGELLNTDLRILAFMRLGIEESARIAQVLNYSLNTIYAYRNRLKARAINRETFEEDVAAIESV